MKLLRRGGLLLCDNAFFHGAAVDPNDRSPNALGVRAFNELAARDPGWPRRSFPCGMDCSSAGENAGQRMTWWRALIDAGACCWGF